jgi:hypothetical protein
MFRFVFILCLLAGCRSTSSDRLPATAAENPDPIFGGTAKLRQPVTENGSATFSATPAGQGQRNNNSDRIGPLTFQPRQTSPVEAAPAGMPPAPAVLTTQVKEPKTEPVRDAQVQPAQGYQPASSPQVVEEYRQRMNRFGVAGLRTKGLPNGTWEAVGHFPVASQPNQLRRIEANGANEADALLAILEQLEKPQ